MIQKGIAWVVSVDMGYGHQRAAYPLKDIAYEKIITANTDRMISSNEIDVWERTRKFYEYVSRLVKIPIIGKPLFLLYDRIQAISPFFPFRDLSKPTMGTLFLKRSIEKGLCKSLIDYVKTKDMPFITTHPIPAVAAHYNGLKKIYCVVTDTDLNRAWVIDEPKKNTITYLAPCIHVAIRLREYGIPDNQIIMTGFPLPKENIGGEKATILKKDVLSRLMNLDPNKIFIKEYEATLKKKLGSSKIKKDHPLTITYMVGGAGAEIEVGIKIARSIRKRIENGSVKLNLVAGIRLDVFSYYNKEIKHLGLNKYMGKNIDVIFGLSKMEYFMKVNQVLRKTDILWTKPSEMSFYTALGLPIIIAPPIGSHENYNKEWLHHIGSGFVQENPDYTNDWLFYWLEDGRLAQAAWEGFREAPSLGTYKIETILKKASKSK